MAELTEVRKAILLAYCRLEPDEVDPDLLHLLYDDAVSYMEDAGVSLPAEDTERRAKYDMCVNALVLDAYDNPGVQIGTSLQENRSFRRRLNQLKDSEPVPNLGTGTNVSGDDGCTSMQAN